MSSADFGTTGTPGSRLRADREASALTSKDLAGRVGISRSHLRALELGFRRITETRAHDFARVLGTDPSRYHSRRG